MRQCGAVAAFTPGKGRKEFRYAFAKVDRQAEDRAQLDHDRVHLPVAAAEVKSEDLFGDSQMRRRAYRKKFGEAFDDAEESREKVIVHRINLSHCRRLRSRAAPCKAT